MRGHLKRAQLQQPEAQALAFRRIHLVDAELRAVRVAGDIDQQIAEQAVQDVGRTIAVGQLAERDFELVEGVHSRFIDARVLAGRPDVHAGKKVGERRMVLPERDHAAQQVGPAQDGAVQHRLRAENDVAASAGGEMAAVVGELAGDQAIAVRLLVQDGVEFFELVPVRRRGQIDLEHAGVGRQPKGPEARIGRRRVALQPDRNSQVAAGVFHRGDQVQVVGHHRGVGQEDVQAAFDRLNAERGPDQLRRGLGCARERRQRIGCGLYARTTPVVAPARRGRVASAILRPRSRR